MGPDLHGDPRAALEETDRRYVDAGDWTRALEALAGALRNPRVTPALPRPLRQGDLVIACEAFGVGRRVYGNKVDVVDPTHERGFRTCLVERVRGLDWAAGKEGARSSA